ncbi:MAG TPA: hypothetical protein ENL20_10170, partial [Candidatus Cloacimonetes bacterium]|nr:hypothetical protein [Candidatus Cloacimonadota bacterium]
MNNKKVLVILMTFIFTAIIAGIPVDLKDAEQVACNWYLERTKNDNLTNVEIIETFQVQEDSEDIYYIFNFQEGGYIIIAADDAIIPVLGYNFEHHYGLEDHPVRFDAMLENFKEQIVYAKDNNLPAPKKTIEEWERLNVKPEDFEQSRDLNRLGPLLDSMWNQNYSWNTDCPADTGGPGGYVYAGCVAVAMAQILNYWEYPATGTGSHGYTHPDYGYLSANFGATTYNFPMNNTSPTDASRELLYHCGVSVDMDYGPEGSGAYTSDCVYAFETYFNYDNSAYYDQKAYHTDTEWENMLRDNLDNGYPLQYRGYGSGGHSFNLDGYETGNNSHFHFNWGWSGSYNGYYYLNDLTPGSYNFTSSQAGIFNLFPDVQPEITVTSPNGGEDWELDSTHYITWTSQDIGPNVKIEIYDGGSLYDTIISSTTDDGSYSWDIPDTYDAGAQYTIKIEDTADAFTYDYSDSYFTLSTPPVPEITVTSPNGGESWQVDSTHNMTWTSSNTSGNVKI